MPTRPTASEQSAIDLFNKLLDSQSKKTAPAPKPSGGGATLAHIASGGNEEIKNISSEFQPVPSHAPLNIPQQSPLSRIAGQRLSTTAPRGYQQPSGTFAQQKLIPESQSPEAQGWRAQQPILQAASKSLPFPENLVTGFASLSPETAGLTRAAVGASEGLTLGLPDIIDPKAMQGVRGVISTGSPSLDWLTEQGGNLFGTAGVMKGLGKAIETVAPAIDPALRSGIEFGTISAPGNIAETVQDIKSGTPAPKAIARGAVAEGTDIAGGALLSGAAGATRMTEALKQAGILSGTTAASSIARGEIPNPTALLQSAALGATFGALGHHADRMVEAMGDLSPDGQKTIRETYAKNYEATGGDPDKAAYATATDLFDQEQHGPNPVRYARQVTKNFRVATGEPVRQANEQSLGLFSEQPPAVVGVQPGAEPTPQAETAPEPTVEQPKTRPQEVSTPAEQPEITQPTQEGEQYAAQERQIAENDQLQYQGATQGTEVQGQREEVRQEESQQDRSGNGILGQPTEEEKVTPEQPAGASAPPAELAQDYTVYNIPLSDIHTDPEFQNREEPYSEESVQRIVNHYDPAQFEPIQVWRDPESGNLITMNHSRLEAFNRMGMESIPGRLFEGTREEAVNLALNSNVRGTPEALTERAKIYRAMRDRGDSNASIERTAKETEGANASTALALSRLDPNSKAIQDLRIAKNADPDTRADIQKKAKWTGEIQKAFPEFTRQHQNEIYTYLRDEKMFKSEAQAQEFVQRAYDRASVDGGFDQTQPLNLKSAKDIHPAETEFINRVKEAKSNYEAAKNDLAQTTEEAIAQGFDENHPVVQKAQAAANVAQNAYRDLLMRKSDILARIRGQSENLFEAIDNHPQPETLVPKEAEPAIDEFLTPGGDLDEERLSNALRSADENSTGTAKILNDARDQIQQTIPVEETPGSTEVPPNAGGVEGGNRGGQEEVEPKLPRTLSGAKPRYSYGPKAFSLDFESDVDKASYIAAQSKRSKADDQYVQFVKDATGLTEPQIREHGRNVRASIKEQAAAEEGGTHEEPQKLTVKKQERPFFESDRPKPKPALHMEIVPGLSASAENAARGFDEAGKIQDRIQQELKASQPNIPDAKEPQVSTVASPTSEASPIGISNNQIDAMREKYGMNPRLKAIRVSHPDAYSSAMDKLTENPNTQTELVESLSKHPRATEPWENVLLVRERAMREASYEQAADEINNAKTDYAKAEAKTRHDIALERLNQLANTVDRVGTISAQSLESRKILLNSDDLTLAQMQRQYQARAKAGDELTDEDKQLVQGKFDELQKAKSDISDIENASANKRASDYLDELVKENTRLKEANKQLQDESWDTINKLRTGEIRPALYGDKLKAKGQDYLARGRQRLADIASGKIGLSASVLPIHPELLRAYSEIGVGHLMSSAGSFADWSAKMVKDIGEKVKPHLNEIFQAAKKEYFSAVTAPGEDVSLPQGKRGMSPQQVLQNIETNQTFDKHDIYILAKAHVDAGETGMPVFEAVHKEVQQVMPDATLRGVRDAFTDYGKQRFPSKDEAQKEMRRIRSLGQLTSKIEDANSGTPPKKTGLQRDKPDVEVRSMMKKLMAAMRDNNIEIRNPEQQIATQHQARLTRLQNGIEDIERQLRTGERPPERKPMAEWTPQEKALRDRLNALKEERKKVFALTEQEIYAKKLDAAKRALATREAELRSRFTEGDFAKKTRAPALVPDQELFRAKARYERLKNAWYREVSTREQAQWPRWKKVLDMTAKLRRFGALTALTIVNKLTAAAAVSQVVSAPLEDISSSIWKHIPGISNIAEQAPRWGAGFSFATEAASWRGAAKGLNDGFKMLVGIISNKAKYDASRPDYSVLYGKDPKFEQSALDRIGMFHAALKEPAKQGEFMRSLYKRLNHAVENGRDVNDPIVYEELARNSYEDAERRIWMNENAFTTAVKQGERMLMNSKRSPVTGPALATAIRMELPITRVPTNIASEVFNYSVGVPVGLTRAIAALIHGAHDLPQEKAESIMRQLSKGTPTAAALMLGIAYSKSVGGFYVQGEKRGKDMPDYGEVKIGDTTLSKDFFHTQLGMTLQLGATIGHALDMQKFNFEERNTAEAIASGSLGLAENIPYFNLVSNLGKNIQYGGKGMIKYVGDELKGWVEPSVVQWAARKLDTDSQGEPIKRKPETWKDIFEDGLPYLRQFVPANKPVRSSTIDQIVSDMRAKSPNVREEIQQAHLKPEELRTAIKEARLPDDEVRFGRKTVDKMIESYSTLSTDEQRRFRPIMVKKYMRTKQKTPELTESFRKAIAR